MQVNKPFVIECIYKGTNKTSRLDSFINCEELVNLGTFISTLKYEYGKPIGFKLIKLNVPVDNSKLINWLQTEFKDLFDPDPLLWFASVGTMPIELRQYLIPFHAE